MSKKALYLLCLITIEYALATAQTPGKTQRFTGHDIHISADAGRSLLLEQPPTILGDDFKAFFDHLRHGWTFGGNVGYYFNRYVGCGLGYNYYHTNFGASDLKFQALIFTLEYDAAGKMNIHSLTPTFDARLPLLDDRLLLEGRVGPSWMIYRSNGSIDTDSANFNGSLPGITANLSASYMFNRSIGLRLNSAYLHAFVPQSESGTSLEDQLIALVADNYRKISRINFSAGLVYYFRFR